ncbi:AI-2E family transporter YdiK [Buchnera aphidicola (Mindarus keteleerifoliae)]|uniref:AI-2E family transporter YdiK n=1 Tax=Buchnera aphidicola TaxID=9 RepID=UPI0031B71BF2
MQNTEEGMDSPKSVFSLMFIGLMILVSFWVLRPFLLSFLWASMIVIATWPLMLKIQELVAGRRFFAVSTMIIGLLLLFFVPLTCIINSLINGSIPFINCFISGNFDFPNLIWLQDIPIIGKKMFFTYHKLLKGGGGLLISQVQPYIGKTTYFFVTQAENVGHCIIHFIFTVVFSTFLYWKGEKIAHIIRYFAFRLADQSGDAVVLLAGQAVRAVALGVVVTAFIQGMLAGVGLIISGIPYSALLMLLIFLLCLIQLGPLPVLVPAIIWLFWRNNVTWGTILLFWSFFLFVLDNILRPMLIRIGADLPTILILSGVVGGLLAFGTIGIFVGPVVLLISYRLITSWMNETSYSGSISKKVIYQLKKNVYKKNI